MILAGYRELMAEQVDRNTAYEAVRRASLATYRKTTRSLTRALLALSRDPVGALSRVSWPGVWRRTFGAAMGFEERVSADRVDLVVTHCAFHQFFVDHSEPLLTRIVSEIDRNWMDEVNRSKRPVRVERPLTMSTGCERCEFQFTRATGEAGPAPDIVLERSLVPSRPAE